MSQREEDSEDLEQRELDRQARIQEEKFLRHYSSRTLVLPSCSRWFSFNEIHEIEVQSLPEFFCGRFPQKTPQVYYTWRNFIIKLYREKPQSYLSATECRRKIAGDICSVIRLHAFLEHWGLINFNVSTYLRPPKIHLGSGNKPSNDLVDIVNKGYLKL